jgi:predicted transcriptional regulator
MIAMAKQENSHVVVYDEKGHRLFSKSGELVGFTASNVSIKEGSHVVVYDEKGHRQFSR